MADEKKTVLIIDDDPDLIAATQAVLEGAGYAVASSLDGTAGVERVRQGGIDCVLLDVMMVRDTEGFRVAQDLKGDPATAGIPIVMLTSVGQKTGFEFSPETDEDYLPVEAFLEKPVDPDRLLEVIEEAMGGQQ
ncbi:MAG: response regulator [Planctomycetes bacterium]|nr:response regulator [Planctomycetota bacterium]